MPEHPLDRLNLEAGDDGEIPGTLEEAGAQVDANGDNHDDSTGHWMRRPQADDAQG